MKGSNFCFGVHTSIPVMHCSVCDVCDLGGNRKGFIVVAKDSNTPGFGEAVQKAVKEGFGRNVHVVSCDPPLANEKDTTQVIIAQNKMVSVHVGACANGNYVI